MEEVSLKATLSERISPKPPADGMGKTRTLTSRRPGVAVKKPAAEASAEDAFRPPRRQAWSNTSWAADMDARHAGYPKAWGSARRSYRPWRRLGETHVDNGVADMVLEQQYRAVTTSCLPPLSTAPEIRGGAADNSNLPVVRPGRRVQRQRWVPKVVVVNSASPAEPRRKVESPATMSAAGLLDGEDLVEGASGAGMADAIFMEMEQQLRAMTTSCLPPLSEVRDGAGEAGLPVVASSRHAERRRPPLKGITEGTSPTALRLKSESPTTPSTTCMLDFDEAAGELRASMGGVTADEGSGIRPSPPPAPLLRERFMRQRHTPRAVYAVDESSDSESDGESAVSVGSMGAPPSPAAAAAPASEGVCVPRPPTSAAKGGFHRRLQPPQS